MIRITESKVRDLATWLKLLQEATIKGGKINLTKSLQDYNMPYSNVIPSILIKRGILRLADKRIYYWDSVDPSTHMAEAIFEKCREATNKKGLNQVNTTTAPSITSADIKSAINQLKQGLVNLGFSETKAKDIIINEFL